MSSPPHAPDLRTLTRAQQAQREGRWEESLELYRAAVLAYPVLRELVSVEIDRVSHKLHQHRMRGRRGARTQAVGGTLSMPHAAASALTEGPQVRARAYQDFCNESLTSFLAVPGAAKPLPALTDAKGKPQPLPLVSVVMTSFNAEDTIQEAVESMLNQDYANLEVLVCDDHSSDGTWDILSAMARRCKPLRVMRLNGNYGTYLAKNTAARWAQGEVVLFQDSDDISHPARVRIQVGPLLADPQLMATRTKYLRFRETDGSIIPVGGLSSKYGLITLAVRRRAFKEIGYFDAVRRAGDDEWVQRLQHVYGAACMKALDVTLYAARLRENSLVADMIVFNEDGSVEQKASRPRWDYVNLFRARFAEQPRDFFGTSRFPPFPLRPQRNYPPTIAALPIPAEKVFVAICSIPQRQNALLSTLSSLMHQVDRVYLYLDKYEQPPPYLDSMRRVTVLRSQDHPGLRDNGKFLMYNEVLAEQKGAPFYWFTCDDDIVYPSDYVHTLLNWLGQYEQQAVVGLHGVVVDEAPKRYFRHRYVYHYENTAMRHPRLVNNLGTGTVAFHSSVFGSIDPYAWPQGGMVDIFFSVLCARQGVPMVCLPRHAGWLKTLAETEETPSLIGEFREDDRAIVDVLRAHQPWGLTRMRQTVQRFDGPLRQQLEAAMPAFSESVDVRFDNYRNYLPGQPG